MVEVHNTVSTEFVVNDHASRQLGLIGAATSRMSGLFEHASTLVGGFGTVAGAVGAAFSLHEAITGTQAFLQSLKRIQDFTGMATQEAGGLLDAMGDVGIESHEAEAVLGRMAKVTQRMTATMGSAKVQTGGMKDQFIQLGLAGKTPEQQLMRMAELAKKNQVSVAQISNLYRVQPASAQKLLTLLRQGPEAIKEEVEEFRALGIATQENVNRSMRISKLQNQIKDSWEKIGQVIGVAFGPVIEKLLTNVDAQLKSWIPLAKQFGDTLSKILTENLDTIMKMAKILAANFALQRATGMGMTGWAGKIGGRVAAAAVPKSEVFSTAATGLAQSFMRLGPGLKTFAVGAAVAAGQALRQSGTALAVVARNLSTTLSPRRLMTSFALAGAELKTALKPANLLTGARAILPGIGKVATGAVESAAGMVPRVVAGLTSLGPVLAGIGQFLLVGAAFLLVVGTVATAVQMIQNNVDGMRFYIAEFADRFRARLTVIWDLLEPVTHLFTGSGAIGSFFTKLVPAVIGGLGEAVDGILAVIQTILIVMSKMSTGAGLADVIMHPMQNILDAHAQATKRTADALKRTEMDRTSAVIAERTAQHHRTPEGREKQPYHDFRNSRFDITQKFAEGFDPDRIAVAFTQDLAGLADKRTQSGFAPLFGV